MTSIPAKIKGQIDRFLADEELQARFELELENVGLVDLFWPEKNPKRFKADFLAVSRNVTAPYPLWDHELRFKYIEKKINAISCGESAERIHPALLYYYLSLYQLNFKQTEKPVARQARIVKKTKKNAKKVKKTKKTTAKRGVGPKSAAETAVEARDKKLYNRIQRLKRKLAVSDGLKKAKNSESMLTALFEEFSAMTAAYYSQNDEIRLLEGEIEQYRNSDYMHPDIRKVMDGVVKENDEMKVLIEQERLKVKTMEIQVNHLAEQLLSVPEGSRHTEEVENIRHEYALLSEKYDSIVSKNIELANRLDRIRNAKTLEDTLDLIRDKINAILRTDVKAPDDLLLKKIGTEIKQLTRARVYLGRALYDIGMLYLRLGNRNKAITELRAARELGIEDPEINKILNPG